MAQNHYQPMTTYNNNRAAQIICWPLRGLYFHIQQAGNTCTKKSQPSVEQNRIRTDVKRKLSRQSANSLFHKITSYLPIETGESVEAGSAWQSVAEKAGAPH